MSLSLHLLLQVLPSPSLAQKLAMKPSTLLSIVLTPLLLVLLLPAHPSVAHETLHSMCNFLGGDYVNYDYCFSTLSSDPASSTADGHTLAVIAVNLTAANATAIRSLTDSLSSSTSDNAFVRSALRKCSTMYAAAAPDLRRSTEAAESRNYTAAAVVLSTVLRVPSACDEAFVTEDGVAVASPIRKENSAFSDLVTLARAINDYMS